MRCTPLLPIAVAAGLALAGVARAQPLDLTVPAPRSAPVLASPIPAPALPARSAQPMPDLANPADPLAPTTLQSKVLSSAVFAKTAVDHRFDKRQDLAVGFLCGLQPGHAGSGAAAAYGSDPHGRFVGAKFSIAFR